VETRQLGKNGPDISVVGCGAWEAGGSMWDSGRSDRESIDAMRAAIDAGMNWIDTAEAYGEGKSEELVGKAVAGRRDHVLVFTKVAHFASGIRPEEIGAAIRRSLRRLGVEQIDLYQIHWPAERIVPIEEAWGAMARLADEGLARWIGVSNFDRRLVERCLATRHVDSVQNQFSLLHQDDRGELLPWLREQGVGYLAYGPLAFGLLTGAITRETRFDMDDWRSGRRYRLSYYDELFAPRAFERSLARVDSIRGVADRLGIPLATLALRAVVDVPGVTGAIAGSRNAPHVRTNAEAGDVRLDEPTRAEIDRLLGRA
jgi:aryl-alcohol dehydrogenase-like predicted oxidoreductase